MNYFFACMCVQLPAAVSCPVTSAASCHFRGYLKQKDELSDPKGPLSANMPSAAIVSANREHANSVAVYIAV